VGKQVPAKELKQRKRVRIRLRPNLSLTARQDEGGTSYVVSDPVTLAHYRLDERQHFAASLMDGAHTLGDIQKAYEARFPGETLPLEELEAFAAQLISGGLAQNESPSAAAQLFERGRKHRRAAVLSALLNFLFIKVPVCDPDQVLGRLASRTGFLLGGRALALGLGLVLVAVAMIVTRWDEFLARLPTYRALFTPQTLLYFWVAIGLAKLLHELGHALCCKAQGGAVNEMGVALMLFCPTLYCNVSDSWRLPGKWQRMAIAAAGIYVDLLVAALATFLWWVSDRGALLHNLCFGLMVVCGVSTLAWNANPLLRFDGYYVLSDWLEVPNLYERSAGFLRSSVLRWVGVNVPAEPPPPPGKRVLFVVYALASSAYRLLMTAGVLYFLATFLEPYGLGALGPLLGVAGVLAVVGRPAWAVVRAVFVRGRLPEIRAVRLWLVLGTLGGVLGLSVLVPLPMRVEGEALIEVDPDHVQRVVVPEAGGFVSDIPVRDGQAVRAGDVLAVLTNPKLEIRLRLNEADQALRSQQLSGQVAEVAEGGGPVDQPGGIVSQTEFELKALAGEHAALREQCDRLTLRARCDGVVVGLAPQELKGKWLEKGTEVCRVADPRFLRAVLLIDPADHRLVGPGSRAWVLVHGTGWDYRPAVVTGVAQVEAKEIPPQLSSRAGGEVLTEEDPVSRAEKPRNQSYLVAVRVPGPDPLVHPGVLGRAKIEVESQTVWWRCHRYLARTFGWGL
jgi:putative peptide zinc metalloprotease protein